MSERERIVDRLTRLVDDPDGLDDPDARAIIVAVLFRVEVVGDVPTELLTTLYRVALWCRDGIRNVETVRDVGLRDPPARRVHELRGPEPGRGGSMSDEVPTRSRRRRAERGGERVSETEPNEGAGDESDVAEPECGKVVPHLGSGRRTGMTTAPHLGSGLAELAALPLVDHHPLARYLFDRGVSVSDGARMLGVSRWTLRDWIACRSAPPSWRAIEISVELGYDDASVLFPTP